MTSLIKVKELHGFDVYQSNYPKTNLTDFYSWLTNYLDSDISDSTFEEKENFNKINMNIFFLNRNVELEMKIYENGNINFKIDDSELENIIINLKNKSKSLYDFLLGFGNYLNIINPQNKIVSSLNKEETTELNTESDCESEYVYDSDSQEWNPYEDFNINTKNRDFLHMLSKIKSNALEKYKEGFNPGKLDISQEFIINVITKEIEDINDNFKLVKLEPIDFDMFNLDIHFRNFDNEILSKNLDDLNIDSIIMNIKLNHNLYPYYPPQVSFKTKLDNKLDIAIINLSYFNPESWNPTNTLLKLVEGVHKILNNNCKISDNNDKFPVINSIIQNILSFNSILPKCLKEYNIEIETVKITESKDKNNDSKHWASGIGYGCNGRSDWDINKFIETKKMKSEYNTSLFKELSKNITSNKENKMFHDYLLNSDILELICTFLKQLNLIELENNFMIYSNIFDILNNLNLTNWEHKPISELNNIGKSLEMFYNESSTFLKFNKDINKNTDKFQVIIVANKYYELIKDYIVYEKILTNDIRDEYCKVLKEYQFDDVSKEDIHHKHHYRDQDFNPSSQCKIKISKELATYYNSLPLNFDSSVFLRCSEDNIQLIQVMIIGPQGTPYENGCFLFDIYIPNNYPNSPPKVNLQTTGNGKVRFNPNLYNSGKVCLSILGTWSGSQQEKWNKGTSTLLQVLVSIQSLILVENPYFNEPGYERDMHTENGKRKSNQYNQLRQVATIEWAIIDMLKNPPNNFKNVISNHFKYKKDSISSTVEKWYNESVSHKADINKKKNDLLKLFNNL